MEPEAGLGAGAVAELLGVAVTTLRSWDRRYGLGPTDHEAGRHRRYTARDVARLRLMRRLTYAGVPPAEAARAALTVRHPEREAPDPPVVAARAGGGRTIPVGRAVAAARGLARAAAALDATALLEALGGLLERDGVRAVWEDVLTPLLIGTGVRWEESGGDFVEVEHVLSWCVSSALRSHTGRAPRSGRPVLLAAAPGEEHTLALEALAAVLAERGRHARMLGARVPGRALAAAVRRLGPSHVVVWSQTPESADPSALPGGVPVVRAGPGWGADGATSLAGALAEL